MVFISLALAASACNNGSSSNPTTPSTPKTTDTLSGTLQLNQVKGSSFQPFTVSTTGEVDVTLTAATPPSNITMGLGIGTTGSGSCVLLAGGSTQTAAGTSPQLSGILSPATYCVTVYDIGQQTAAITWTATVTHP